MPVSLVILKSHIHRLGTVTGIRRVIPFPAIGKPVYMMKVPKCSVLCRFGQLQDIPFSPGTLKSENLSFQQSLPQADQL